MEVTIVINGKPVGKERPRSNWKQHRTYTPVRTTNYERLVRSCFYQQANGFRFPDKTPLTAKIIAYFPVPTSETKKYKAMALNGGILPLVAPDCDNIAKIVLDALQDHKATTSSVAFTGLYHDDRCVSKLIVEKYYSDKPRVEVTISENKTIGGINE